MDLLCILSVSPLPFAPIVPLRFEQVISELPSSNFL